MLNNEVKCTPKRLLRINVHRIITLFLWAKKTSWNKRARPSLHVWACRVCQYTNTYCWATFEALWTGFEGQILFHIQAQCFFRPFHLIAWYKLNLMICPGNKTPLYTPHHGVPLQPVLLLCFIQLYYIHFCGSFMVIFSYKCVSMNYDCLCRGKWSCMFLHGKRVKRLW